MIESSEPFALSPEGRRRRETMLPGLLNELDRTVRTRRRRERLVGALTCVLVALTGAWFTMRPDATSSHLNEAVVSARAIDVEWVTTDPNILSRYSVAPAVDADLIDDTRLLAALAEIGRPAGLIYVDGKATIANHLALRSN